MHIHDEFELIRLIKTTLPRSSPNVYLGIGDDAAIVRPPKKNMVATVDTLVEGVHFDLSYMNAFELGHKALAVNLSDIAAMGAHPLYALVSIGLKQDTSEHFVTELYRGISSLAEHFDVDIIGGNTVQSPLSTLIDITVIGESTAPCFTRMGAKENDIVAITGYVGSSAAGLVCLKNLGRPSASHAVPELVKAHLMPSPRVREALALQNVGAVTAMIDISDGVAREIHHIAERSNVGVWIDEAKLPISPFTEKASKLVSSNPRAWALYGGEDYELLMTLKPSKVALAIKALRKIKTSLTIIGKVVKKSEGVHIQNREGSTGKLPARGWNHFVRRVPPKQR